ncbi:MAG: STAS domain-containing protein [Bryobacterales bacterium]|nr:STAS domain-containing protein [Bryobacterales bacterium]
MSLEIARREREGIVILDLNGRLVAGDETSALREYIREMAGSGTVQAILNLKEVDYIDSTGLGTLVICFTTVRKAGGILKLLNLTRRNVELIVLTKLETVFEVFNDEQEAVNSFFPDRKVTKFDILAFVQQNQRE